MAKIAVVVPVYNVEKYIDRCIASILKQSFEDFRLILVNDGSTDRSGDICDFYGTQDTRITVIHQDMLKVLYTNLVDNKAEVSICNFRPVIEGALIEDQKEENQAHLLNNIEAVNEIVEKIENQNLNNLS